MALKIKPLLLKCDFVGFIPHFRILNEFRYKSVFSSILSLLIILFSIIFILFSFIDFIHQKPKIEYYKSNDYETNKTFLISDSLLMFKNVFICNSNDSVRADLNIYFNNPLEKKIYQLKYEPCELGKNINLKYKDLVETFNSIEYWDLSKYLCINYNNKNFSLNSNPLISLDNENKLELMVNAHCEDYILNFELITQNDIIDHNKDNPFIPYYKRSEYVLKKGKQKLLVYNYQYIKYESDDGFIFSKKKIIDGIGNIGLDGSDSISGQNNILSITFKINSDNYDYYKRTSTKFQSFLADIMSLINLLINISNVISEFLLYKKMNKDIIRNILTSDEKKKIKREKIICLKDKIFHNIFENDEKAKKNIVENNIKEDKTQEEQNSKASFNITNIDNVTKVENNDKIIINVMKKLNFINIIKSFFCFKGKKIRLINLCDDIVKKDICVERILKRLYRLENNYNLIIQKSSNESNSKDKFSKIKKIITKIDIELEDKTKKPG